MKTKHLLLLAIAMLMALPAMAQVPDGYYDAAKNKKDKALLQALGTCIATSKKVTYDGLWDAYKTTDNNGGYYWDMYATTKFPLGSKHCGNYSSVGDCVNREHSFPKSWWGSTKDERYSDLFHLYPTDGYVNNQRSAYPFGECANGTYLPTNGTNKPLGKLGNCTYPTTYSGKVFEPDDEYKGDFARSYFYMAARYYDKSFSTWSGNMCGEQNYLAYKDWAVTLLLKWHRQDPVSEKEINRNNAVYATAQANRNPFIDHPELVEYIWGDKRGEVWNGEAVALPTLTSPAQGTVVDFGTVAVNRTSPAQTITVKGVNLTENLNLTITGNRFSTSVTTITAAQANEGFNVTLYYNAPATTESSTATLTIKSGEVSTTVNLKGQCVSGIPALAATDVTQTSFRARWTAITGTSATYQLHVYGDDGSTEIDGYPKNVTAADGNCLVTGLEANTTYYYKLTDGSVTSNVVEVTTLDNAKVISIQFNWEFLYTECAVNTMSPILTAEVYTEYITEPIELTVSGNFDISLDKQTWVKKLDIDPEGEVFYIRISDTSKAGIYEGELVASTATLDGYSVEVEGMVYDSTTPAETVTEDWEGVQGFTNYDPTNPVQGAKFKWNFSNAALPKKQTGDHYNGEVCCRLGNNTNSSITMAEDYTKGASGFSFYAAPFGSDAEATLTVGYSTDGGKTWVDLQTFTVAASASKAPAVNGASTKATGTGGLTQYTVTEKFNVKDNVRFRIVQSKGKRVNIDDIRIDSYALTPTAIDNVAATGVETWFAYAGRGTVTIQSDKKAKFYIYNLDAREMVKSKVSGKATFSLPAGLYIVTDGKTSSKVVVR